MNSAKLIIGAVARHLLAAIFVALVSHGLMTQHEVDILPVPDIAVGIAGFICIVGWSLWEKASAKWKFLQALQVSPYMATSIATEIVENKPRTIPGTIAVLTGGGQ